LLCWEVARRIYERQVSPSNKLKYNEDGSVDLVIQRGSPDKARESNWLPAPDGRFIPMLRMYWPKETRPSIVDGTWSLPPVTKVHGEVHAEVIRRP